MISKSNLILAALVASIAVLVTLVLQDSADSKDKSQNQRLAVENAPQANSIELASNDTADMPALSLEQLARQLAQEKQQREKLEKQVQQLSVQVGALTHEKSGKPSESGASAEAEREDKTITTGARNIPQQVSGWVDAQRLAEAGMSNEQAASITQLYESVEMDKLYLRDRARREGWMASDRFRDEMDKLDQRTSNLRNELGDKAYDALLYATGRPNRVLVEGTLGNSPAAQAGIKQGDTILRYADKSIYSWYDLRQATGEGDANEMVPVEIQRGNKHLEVYVKRGPLGIRLDQQSINPAP